MSFGNLSFYLKILNKFGISMSYSYLCSPLWKEIRKIYIQKYFLYGKKLPEIIQKYFHYGREDSNVYG